MSQLQKLTQSFTLIERRSATKCRICICTFSHILTKFAEISIVTVSFVPELNGVSLTSHVLRFPLLYDLSKNQQSAKKLKKPTNIQFLVGLYRGTKQHNFFFWGFKDQHFPKLSKLLFCWSSYNIRNFVCGLVTSTFFLIRRGTCVWRKQLWFAFKALFFRLGAFFLFHTKRIRAREFLHQNIDDSFLLIYKKQLLTAKWKKLKLLCASMSSHRLR